MPKSIAIVVYGDTNRNALTEEYYQALGQALIKSGCSVKSVSYNDSRKDEFADELAKFNAALVWVNPDEQGGDRSGLDALLLDAAKKGVYVSTHPEVILKIGTKKVLYTTKDMDWGGDVRLYADYEDFQKRFLASMDGKRVLKQYRGSSGRGIFKIDLDDWGGVCVVPATAPADERIFTKDEFHKEFSKYFENGGMLINQEWYSGITNGMVRCYITGSKVSGFGYQESIALCPWPVSRRFYFSENCGLFQDLRYIMETKWIPELQQIHSIADEMMPLLWDIDLFINDVNTTRTEKKYSLCEINVSCVSPFPPSCIPHIVEKIFLL